MRKLILGLTVGLSLLVTPGAGAAARVAPVVQAFNVAARPIHAIGGMVGDAEVVGVGEATHGTHEFFQLQHQVFAQLVRTNGFGTFAREVSWSGGLRIDDYVTHGIGDPRQIMREEFQGSYQWNTEEYLDLIQWMRAYNQRHPNALRFMGDDIGYPGPQLFDRVLASAPPAVAQLYDGMAPEIGAGEWMNTYPLRPLAERLSFRDRAWQAVELLRHGDPVTHQHAMVIARSMTMWAADFTDPAQVTAAFDYRETALADNVLWWREHTGDKIVVAGHDGHVATASYWGSYPQVQGTVLRQRLGDAYVSIGTTFHHGEYTDSKSNPVSLAPAAPGSNESTVDQAWLRDFALDLRTAPRAAQDWLAQVRPTRQAAEAITTQQIALGRSFDILVHFNRTTASRLLP